jgi:hypothetical protein
MPELSLDRPTKYSFWRFMNLFMLSAVMRDLNLAEPRSLIDSTTRTVTRSRQPGCLL